MIPPTKLVWQFIWILAAFTAVALLGLFCLALGNGNASREAQIATFQTACIDQGGVPILDNDGNECVFPPPNS